MLKLSPKLISAVALLSSNVALAKINVCDLKNLSLPAGVSQEQVDSYQKKISQECDLFQKYQEVKNHAENKFSIALEEITIYQAMRFVQRSWYETSKRNETPIEVTYQIKKEDYQKTNAEKSHVIWDNWVLGIKQLEPVVASINQGDEFTFSKLQDVHRGFFTLSDEQGDYAHRPDPGKIKAPSEFDNPWWAFKTAQEAQSALNVVATINANYKAMDMLADVKAYPNDIYVNNPVNVKPFNGGYSIYSGDSRANPTHIKNLFKFINTMLEQNRQNQHMVWNGRLMTPGEVAFFAQQFYVHVHPFAEGNGRTSRFIQELILTSMDMPRGSSGDLMDIDVLTPQDQYYQIAITKTREVVDRIGVCLDSYKNSLGLFKHNVHHIKSEQLDYDCRLVAPTQVTVNP